MASLHCTPHIITCHENIYMHIYITIIIIMALHLTLACLQLALAQKYMDLYWGLVLYLSYVAKLLFFFYIWTSFNFIFCCSCLNVKRMVWLHETSNGWGNVCPVIFMDSNNAELHWSNNLCNIHPTLEFYSKDSYGLGIGMAASATSWWSHYHWVNDKSSA